MPRMSPSRCNGWPAVPVMSVTNATRAACKCGSSGSADPKRNHARRVERRVPSRFARARDHWMQEVAVQGVDAPSSGSGTRGRVHTRLRGELSHCVHGRRGVERADSHPPRREELLEGSLRVLGLQPPRWPSFDTPFLPAEACGRGMARRGRRTRGRVVRRAVRAGLVASR
jgi:hypothetical protein